MSRDEKLKCLLAGFRECNSTKVRDLIINLRRIIVQSRSLIYVGDRELNKSSSIAFPTPHFYVVSTRAWNRHFVVNKGAWRFGVKKHANLSTQIAISNAFQLGG